MDFISDFVLSKLKDIFMSLMNTILTFVVGLISSLLPVIGVSPEFTQKIDNAITIIINLLNNANYILPIDVMVLCWTVMLSFDISMLMFRIVQWIIKLVRG